ncbi:MAG: 30S ribosome-binding factor RbfA [Gemmatimonadetes bacterium]|nr:MAG: 30S ribosome-binding factor RbfA [Gemmatimonadota bacterium]
MMRRPGPPPRYRPERVAELIRRTVAEFLTGGVRDPRVGFVTVTAVEVSGDLAHARVRVSVMGTEEEKAKTLAGLGSAARFLRAQLSRELRRTAPADLRRGTRGEAGGAGGAGGGGGEGRDAGPHLPRHRGSGAPRARHPAGGALGNARPVCLGAAGCHRGTRHPARALRRRLGQSVRGCHPPG